MKKPLGSFSGSSIVVLMASAALVGCAQVPAQRTVYGAPATHYEPFETAPAPYPRPTQRRVQPQAVARPAAQPVVVDQPGGVMLECNQSGINVVTSVVGAVAGGFLGSRFGKGNGKAAMTGVGAGVGAIAGNSLGCP